jgi:hypothetical protein
MGQVMETVSDIKEVGATVVGAVFGPEAKAAAKVDPPPLQKCTVVVLNHVLKVALNVIPDTGPSHIDQATNGIAAKIFGGPI